MATRESEQIARIHANIKASLAKVAAKGVTVPANATSDDLPGLIESIPTSEDLTAVLDAQEAKLNELLNSLDAKSAGGSTVEDLTAVLDAQEAKLNELLNSLDAKSAGGSTAEDNRHLYQRVEYIESAESGTYPYVITDIYADNNCGVEIVASFPSMEDRIPMGSREDSGSTRFYCVYPLSTTSVYCGFGGGTSISCKTQVNTVYRLQTNFLDSRLACVYEGNGTRKASGSISGTLTAHSVPIAIFGYNSAETGAITSRREYRLYSARISGGYEVVREYIPCYRKSDGEIGLYEKFTGQFLANEGTGAFAKGADIDW